MAKGNKTADGLGNEPEHQVVTAVVYAKQGGIMRELKGFVIGKDKVGHSLSMTMGAVRFVDPSTGEVVRKWDPWGLLDS